MSNPFLFDIHLTVDLVQTIASIAVIIDDIEIIIERRQYSHSGLFNFEFLRLHRSWILNRRLYPTFKILFDYPNFIFLISIQLVAAILIVSHAFTSLSVSLVSIILLIHLLSHVRNRYGINGSDQLQVIIFVALFIFYMNPNDMLVQKLSIFFIGFESFLSYFLAGLAKLVSPIWRDGTAIYRIMNTESFGNELFAKILIDKPLLSKLICWWVIIFECIFPFFIFIGIKIALVFIIFGIIFHLSLAIFMRFNSFLWSFIATYPALLYFAYEFQISTNSTFHYQIPI